LSTFPLVPDSMKAAVQKAYRDVEQGRIKGPGPSLHGDIKDRIGQDEGGNGEEP
jgi:hypothetical protein